MFGSLYLFEREYLEDSFNCTQDGNVASNFGLELEWEFLLKTQKLSFFGLNRDYI